MGGDKTSLHKSVKRSLLAAVAAALGIVASIQAAPVSAEMSQAAAAGFLSRTGVGSLLLPGREVTSAEAHGNLWIVRLAPSGYIEVAGSTKCAPILSFSENDFAEPESDSPLAAKLTGDSMMVADKEADESLEDNADWEKYTAPVAKKRDLLKAAPSGTDGSGYSSYVAPLLGAQWNQNAPYSDFTPLSGPCGCAATAGGQEHRYWRWPYRFEGSREVAHSIQMANGAWYTHTIRADGRVPFNYDKIFSSYSGTPSIPSATDKESSYNAAYLTLWMQSLTAQVFKRGSSGATQKLRNFADQFWFERDPVEANYWRDGYTNLWLAIKRDLDWGSPIQVNSPVHVMVVDGYAVENEGAADEVDYINLNYGWGGQIGWVNLRTAVTEGTSGGRLADFQTGYRPQKIVQFEPVPKVSTSDITIKWHIAPCYTNRTTGFAIEIAKTGGATTSDTVNTHEETTIYTATGLDVGGSYTFTVTPIMKEGEGEGRSNSVVTSIGTPQPAPVITSVSSIAGGLEHAYQDIFVECGRGITNNINVTCSTSVTKMDVYSSHLTVLPENKVSAVNNGSGSWTVKVDATAMDSTWDGDMVMLTLVAANSDGTEAYKNLVIRLNSMRQASSGTLSIVQTEAADSVWFSGNTTLDANGQSVTFGANALNGTGTVTLQNGTFTFEGLNGFTGTLKWAPSVTVNLPADMSNFRGTLWFESYGGTYTLSRNLPSTAKVHIGGNTQLYIDNNVTVDAAITGGGYIMVVGSASTFGNLSGFTGHISLGDMDNSGTVTIPAGQEKGVVIDNGTVNLILSKAQVAYGYYTSAITMQGWGSVVFKDESGNTLQTWTSNQSTYAISSSANTWTPTELGTGNFWDAARWSKGLPNAGDYVILNDNFGDTEMTLNLSSDFNLGYMEIVGTKFNIKAADGTAKLYVDTMENEIPTKLATTQIEPTVVIPRGKLFINPGFTISCDIDYSLAQNLRDISDVFSAVAYGNEYDDKYCVWRGTVVFSDYSATGLDIREWGHANSFVRLNGVSGYLAYNKQIEVPVELKDNGESYALHWSNGSDSSSVTFNKIWGDGTFKTSGNGANEKVLLKDVSDFTGQFQLAAKTVAIADEMPTENTGNNGKLHVCKAATIAAGSIWNIGGGVYFGGSCDLDVYGQLWSLTQPMTTYGEGATITLEDGAVIRVCAAMAGSYSPTLNFKAGKYQFEASLTETKTVNFCAATGKYTTLDANGKLITLGANFFSGSGDVYLMSSSSGGSFAIQGISAAYTGTIYVDNTVALTLPSNLSSMGGKINISEITLVRASAGLGQIDVSYGATLQVVLTDDEAMEGVTVTGVTLNGGTIEFVDQRGTVVGSSTESVVYVKPEDYTVPSPEPTAVWISGQFEEDAELHGGYAISIAHAGSINDAGNIVIGDNAYLGAQISLPENTYTKASVLVKFKAPAGGAPAANSVLAGVFDTSEYPIGAICKTAGGTAFEGYYQAKNGTALTTGYNLSSPTILGGEGYMLFSFQSDPTTIQPATGTALYLGDSMKTMTGGAYAGLQWRGYTISSLSVGGPAVATPSPWKGLEIESVALFAGEWFSPSDVKYYQFPTSAEPEPEPEPEYEGPDPIAVWVAGEFGDDRSAHGGLEFALNGNTTNALGQIVIGNSTTLGATVAIPSGTLPRMTMLVKYSVPAGGAPVAQSVPASLFSTYDMGARVAQSGSSSLDGYWLNGSSITTGYAFSSPAQTMPQEGYILVSNWTTTPNNGDHGTAVYSGETLSELVGGEKTGLRFTGADKSITAIGVGGPTVAGAKPWQGMVIKSVALFDEWVATNVIANYKFPAQGAVKPEDSDRYVVEPVASWVNDFKTTTKGDYSLSVSGTTAAKDDSFGGTLTIGDAAAIIDTTAANSANMTVLIKFRAASNVTNAPVVAFGGMGSSAGLDVGVYTKLDKTLAVYRNFSTDNAKPYDFGTAPLLSATGGYVLCARDNGQQCMAYVGDSLDAMTGGTVSDGGIKFSNVTLTKLGIGGNSGMAANANDMVPFAGLEIEKIVVFNGYYTPDQIRYIPNPEDGDTVNISDNTTWTFTASDTPREYLNVGTLSSSGTIAIANASELTEGTYPLATWTTPQQYTTQCAGYGKVGTLVTEGLAEGLSARLIYGARGIYLRVDDTAKKAARKPLVVWCYGDSITEGFNAQATGANYRILLYQKLEMLGYNVRSTGVYGLSNGYNSVDPTGTPLTDQYKWHSAKHGATAGPTTLAHRSNLSENVDTLAIQAGTPDVALLLIGVNDIPEWKSESDRVTPVFKAWTNVVSRMVKNLPDTKIVVSTILYSDGTRTDIDPTITAINTQIKNLLDNLPAEWQGHVVLADLNSYVKSGDAGIIYNDHLHPDWWGYDQMADGYLDAIVKCYPDPDATDFPSQNPIPVAPTSDQLGAANKPELAAYRAGFSKLCNIRVEKGQDVSNVVYDDVNGDAASDNLEKVGYFVEFVRADNHAHKWVWVDMDAFGDADLASVGLPQRNYQQAVTRMHVCSNHGAIDNVAADDDSVTGWIEFSPYDYTRTASNSAAPANYGEPFDWNDTLSESGSYGCMQVFRVMNPSSRDLYERPQLMFAFNNFQSQNSNPADFGIGNFAQHFNCNNSYHTEDWTGVGGTLAKMAPDQYSVKTIEIWTKEAAYSGPEPAAVWVAGEFDDDKSAHGGCEFALNGNTTNAVGEIVIGNATTLGATIAVPNYDNATMLVKYEIPSGGAPAANSVPASVFVTKEMGALAGSGSSDLDGYWLNGSNITAGYAFSSPAPSIPQEGYLLISVPANSNQNPGNHYTAAYVGKTVSTLSGGETSGLRFTGDNNRVTSMGVGGPTVAGAVPWAGMVVKGVAIFDSWLTPDDIRGYKFPEQGAVQPEDSDLYAIEPVARWVNNFKTAETNGCTLSVSGTTAAKDDAFGGVLTVGDSAAVIDTASAEALTVLVKYRSAPAIHSAPVVTFGGQAAVTFDSGICTDTSVDRQLAAYYSFVYGSRKRGIYAVGGNPTLSSDGGYLVCARKTDACLAYVGDSLDNMTGGDCTTDMTLSNSTLRKIGIGGQTELSNNDANMVPFTGFVVEKVVVFNGYYTPDQIRFIPIPEDSDTVNIVGNTTWKFAATDTPREYTNIGTLSSSGTIAITNAAELTEGTYPLATWTTAQKKSTGYGHVGTLDVTGLSAGLSAELVYGAKVIYLRVWNPTTQAEKGTIKVWPYGDSITEGFNAGGTRANYRVLLAQKLSMLGFNVEMVGCYDKINGANGIDPSGQAIPDAWKWHSAKHGATAGPTTSAAGRANLCENVDTLCAQAGNPDVVLLLAGANDIVPATGLSAQQVVSSVTNIVAHIATNLPDTKIVVGNQINVEQGYNSGNYTHVTNMIPQVNTLLKNYVDNLPEGLNGKVFLADLNSYVKSGEYGILFDHGSDHLHPDWWGHDQMAEGWLSVVTNQFTATQTFPSATIPSAPADGELGAAAKTELDAYRQGFKLARRIEAASNLNTANPYAATGDGATEGIEKVAYFVEYVRADNNAHKWVWVDMDAFGTTIGDVGLPTNNHQQVVTKLHVKSNHNGIESVAADDDTVTGFVEFSPYDYIGNVSGVSGAPAGNASCYDWNDKLTEVKNANSGTNACMQVHRVFSPAKAAADGITRGGQVLFAYNNWQSSSSTAEFGIGNFSSHFYRGANDAQTLDYTYTASATKMNASAYSVKRIEIWTKAAGGDEPEAKYTNTDYPVPYSWFSEYYPGIEDYPDMVETFAKMPASNGQNTWWECYVLGLEPTNEQSKLTVQIRMDGTTPIVEYSPTNDAIAIQYILQGKPALSNDWQDVEFDEPGDTNRFFRVKVTW